MPKTRILIVTLLILSLPLLTACGRGEKARDALTTVDAKMSNLVAKGADPAKYYGMKLTLHHIDGGEVASDALSFTAASDKEGFDVTVSVKDTAEFSGLYFSVEFEDGSISPTDVTPGALFGEDRLFLAMLDQDGEVPVALGKINQGKVSGTGEVCTIRFNAKGTVRSLMDELSRPWKVFAPGLEDAAQIE